jgi:type II secretory pathway component HofQ
VKRWLLTGLFAFGLACGNARPLGAAGPISLDVRELDIYDAVRLLSTQASVNVVVDSSVAHRPVSLRLQNVSFGEALATLTATNDLQAVRIGNVIYIGTSEAMNRRYPANTAGTRTVLFAVKNGTPGDVAKSLSDALPKGTLVVPDARTASIIVTGSPTTVARARDLVAALDRVSGVANVVVPMRFVKASDALKALQATLQMAAINKTR